jgi:hypothetical protein
VPGVSNSRARNIPVWRRRRMNMGQTRRWSAELGIRRTAQNAEHIHFPQTPAKHHSGLMCGRTGLFTWLSNSSGWIAPCVIVACGILVGALLAPPLLTRFWPAVHFNPSLQLIPGQQTTLPHHKSTGLQNDSQLSSSGS